MLGNANLKTVRDLIEFFNYFSPFVTAMATIAMAFSSVVTLVFIIWSNCRRNKDDKTFRDEVKSLYQAITISTLMSSPHYPQSYHNLIPEFKRHYQGKVTIFKD